MASCMTRTAARSLGSATLISAVVPAQVICDALAASLLTGVGWAWELVGDGHSKTA